MRRSLQVTSVLKFSVFILGFLVVNSLFSQSGKIKTGISYYYQSGFGTALFTFNNVIKSSVNNELNAEAYYWEAKTLHQLNISSNDKSKIIEAINKAIELKANNSKYYFLRARLEQFYGNKTSNINDDYRLALANAGSEDIYIKGISTYQLNGFNQAVEYIENLEDVNLSDEKKAEQFYCMAVIKAMHGNKKDALTNLNFALSHNTNLYDFLQIDFRYYLNDNEFITLFKKYDIPSYFWNVELPNFTNVEIIKNFVERKINSWQKKGKFEKTVDYQKRVNETARKQKIDFYTKAAIDSIGLSKIDWKNVSNDYDADNESFMINFDNFRPIIVQVPISEAPSFDANFKTLEFNNFGFLLTEQHEIEIGHLEFSNAEIGKTYIFDIQKSIPFNSNQFAFNFENIDLDLNNVSQYKPVQKTTQVVNIGNSDVDENIPNTGLKKEKTIALIIGNEDYSRFQTGLVSEANVDYAKRDAEIFAAYANKTLGIPMENITLLKDATSAQMQREIEKLSELALAYQGQANIIFYYAGHGFPEEQTRESYLMPVDVSGADVRHGIKLSTLYQLLTKNPSKKVVVLLDACFSGGGRNQGLLAARGVQIKPKENEIGGNLIVLTSSSGEQSSLPYSNKQHGMFTYFLLKKLKDSMGEITLEQLSDYLSREVQINSLKINSKKQNPSILVSPDVENIWMDWKIY